MIILKLGGSVITEKDSVSPKVNFDNLNRIATEIKEYLNNSKMDNSDLIIVHGAGSFGHPLAKKYDIGNDFTMDQYAEKKIGFSLIHNHVNKLNTIVCSALIDNNVPVVPISPSSSVTAENKRIYSFNLDLLKRYLNEGFIPVLYGDVVLDNVCKLSVVSGDQIISYLASNLNPDKIILGTDVDGVFNKNPRLYDDAKLIGLVSSLNDLDQLDSTTNVDVTGGMVGKINELLTLTDFGIESKIINANVPKLVLDSLMDKQVKGTIIKK